VDLEGERRGVLRFVEGEKLGCLGGGFRVYFGAEFGPFYFAVSV
jgi:hypothetical protein